MSIGIGAKYSDGFIICADSKIVLEDGSTKIGCKVLTSASWILTTIANASTTDGNAGTTLAGEITDDLANLRSGGPPDCIEAIKKRMRTWYAGYGSPGARPPDMKFIIAIVGVGFRGMYFCEPPQTVIRHYSEPIAIGAGAAVVDPLIPTIMSSVFPLGPTLLRLSYLMYRAKKDQALVGGPTDLLVMPFGTPLSPKDVVWVEREEMETAEILGEFVDDIVRECVIGLLNRGDRNERESFLATFNGVFSNKAEVFSKVQFPSLKRAGLLI